MSSTLDRKVVRLPRELKASKYCHPVGMLGLRDVLCGGLGNDSSRKFDSRQRPYTANSWAGVTIFNAVRPRKFRTLG
jgi:hypothetical protein